MCVPKLDIFQMDRKKEEIASKTELWLPHNKAFDNVKLAFQGYAFQVILQKKEKERKIMVFCLCLNTLPS